MFFNSKVQSCVTATVGTSVSAWNLWLSYNFTMSKQHFLVTGFGTHMVLNFTSSVHHRKTEVLSIFPIFVEMTSFPKFPKLSRKFCCVSLLDVGFFSGELCFCGWNPWVLQCTADVRPSTKKQRPSWWHLLGWYICWWSNLGVSKNRGFSPQMIHFNKVFHYKPSILGYPYFWKHPQDGSTWVVKITPIQKSYWGGVWKENNPILRGRT